MTCVLATLPHRTNSAARSQLSPLMLVRIYSHMDNILITDLYHLAAANNYG
jgi:hypothetical protein